MAKDEYGMPIHPVCEIVPLMDDEALERLVDDVRENGLRVPLWTYKGSLVDGRNRLIACRRAGVKPRFQEWDGDGSLVKFAWSLNGARRDLTAGQRAASAVLMLPILEQEAAERRNATTRLDRDKAGRLKPVSQKVDSQVPDRNAGRAAAEAAKMTGANRTYVADAKKIRTEAPEEFEKLRTGITTIAQATRRHKEQQAKKNGPARVRKAPVISPQTSAQRRFMERHIRCIDQCLKEPQPVSLKRIAEITDRQINNMVRNGLLQYWSLVPWLEFTQVTKTTGGGSQRMKLASPESIAYTFKENKYLRAVCEGRGPRVSAELKSVILALGDLRREIDNRRKEAKISHTENWNPAVVEKAEVVYLVAFIETELDKLINLG